MKIIHLRIFLLYGVILIGMFSHHVLAQGTKGGQAQKGRYPNYYDSTLRLKIYTIVDTPVEYPGGNGALFKWLQKSINLKKGEYDPFNDPNDGKVRIDLYFDKEGNVLDTRVPGKKKNQYSKLEKKVSDLLMKSKWISATNNGAKVAYVYPFFIRFEFSLP